MAVAYHNSVSRNLFFGLLLWLIVSPVAAVEDPPEVPLFPDYTLSTLDGSGKVNLTDFRGRPVLLTFWASWCGPCRVELPELQRLYSELAGDGFVLLTVNVDVAPALATRFLSQIGVHVPVYRMNQRDLVALGVDALPTNILLDREGRPVQIFTGYSPVLSKEIRRLVIEMSSEEDRSS
jgi:thiol-disulfide isomerase/thioredoxin